MLKPAGKSITICNSVLSSREAHHGLSPTQAVLNKKSLLLNIALRLKF